MQQISVKSESSSPIPMPYGVPQGSVLGPILFIMYNIPLHDIASSHGIPEHGCADEEQLCRLFRVWDDGENQRTAFSSLADCIAESKAWAAANKNS